MIFKLVDALSQKQSSVLNLSPRAQSNQFELLKQFSFQTYKSGFQHSRFSHEMPVFKKLEEYMQTLWTATKNIQKNQIMEFQPFVQDRTLHQASVAIEFLQCHLDFNAGRHLADLMSNIGGVVTLEGDSIKLMEGTGLRGVLLISAEAKKSLRKERRRFLDIIVIESYMNIVTLSHDMKQESGERLLVDVIESFQSKMRKCKPCKQCKLCYSSCEKARFCCLFAL